jgi:hypothetical protein
MAYQTDTNRILSQNDKFITTQYLLMMLYNRLEPENYLGKYVYLYEKCNFEFLGYHKEELHKIGYSDLMYAVLVDNPTVDGILNYIKKNPLNFEKYDNDTYSILINYLGTKDITLGDFKKVVKIVIDKMNINFATKEEWFYERAVIYDTSDMHVELNSVKRNIENYRLKKIKQLKQLDLVNKLNVRDFTLNLFKLMDKAQEENDTFTLHELSKVAIDFEVYKRTITDPKFED